MREESKYFAGSPYIKGDSDVLKIMLIFIISLLPAVGFAIYKYGVNALLHLIITVAACAGTDYLYCFFVKKDVMLNDGSSIVTGIILTLLLPADCPYYTGVIGAIFAILIVKRLLGGIVKFYVNPAAAANCFVIVFFGNIIKVYSRGGNGSMGDVSSAAVLIGVVFLIITGMIAVSIPTAYIAAFIIIVTIFGGRGLNINYITSQITTGGFLFAVWFLSTDYASSPVTGRGKVVYGIILGVLTGFVRVFGHTGAEIYFVILFANLFVPLIEKFTVPKPFILTRKII